MDNETFREIWEYGVVPFAIPVTVWLTKMFGKQLDSRIDSRLKTVEHELKTNGGVKKNPTTGKVEGSLKDLNVQQVIDLGQILNNMQTVKTNLESTLGEREQLKNAVVELVDTVKQQGTILETHTGILNKLTGVTDETKDHLDRKILHEAAQKMQAKVFGDGVAEISSGLGGTKLVEEIKEERRVSGLDEQNENSSSTT